MTEQKYEIVVTKGDAEFARYTLGTGEHFLGTAPACAVPIPIEAPGRKFTRMSISREGRVLLEDLESEHGTMLDGLPIVIATWKPGGLVRFEDVTLELWPVAEDRDLTPTPEITPTAGHAFQAAPEETFDISSGSRSPAPAVAAPAAPAPAVEEAAPVPVSTPVATSAPTSEYQPPKPPRRIPGFVYLLLFLAVAGGIGYLIWYYDRNSVPTGAGQDYRNDLSAEAYHSARQLLDDGQPVEALAKIRSALEFANENAEYLYLEGNILETQLHLAEALAAYDQALQRNPHHKFAQQNRALCDQLLRDVPYGAAVNPQARERLATLMDEQGRAAEAAFMRKP